MWLVIGLTMILLFNLFNTPQNQRASMSYSEFWSSVEAGAIHAVNFLVSIFPFVIIMNWLYYKTGRNLIVPIVFHITAGYFNEIFATHPDTKVIQTLLLIIFAAWIVWREKDFFLNKEYGE